MVVVAKSETPDVKQEQLTCIDKFENSEICSENTYSLMLICIIESVILKIDNVILITKNTHYTN